MTPENPEALITIIIAGIGYGIYIGGEGVAKNAAGQAGSISSAAGCHIARQIWWRNHGDSVGDAVCSLVGNIQILDVLPVAW